MDGIHPQSRPTPSEVQTGASAGRRMGVYLVAASAALRRGLQSLVETLPAFRVVGGGAHTDAEPTDYTETGADILIVDVSPHDPPLHWGGGSPPFVFGEGEARERPAPAIRAGDRVDGPVLVLLTDDPTSGWTVDSVRAGVRAVLPRAATDEQLIAALQAVAAGLAVGTPAWLGSHGAADPTRGDGLRSNGVDALTARETEVLRMLADGLGNRAIGARLGISEHTVKFHISAILGKLHVATRTEAVTVGIKLGLIYV